MNVIYESMCYFEVSSIDPAVFAHCSLRLGLVYEALANVLTKKTNRGNDKFSKLLKKWN